MKRLLKGPFASFNSTLFKNSLWGLTGSILQNIFLSIFYILIARHFAVEDFAKYIIANSLYQIIVAFSTMGLGQWFIREVGNFKDKNLLVHKFLKMQAYFGIFFFFLNVILAMLLYNEFAVRVLSILFAFNIIFDNIIYSIKHVNIAEFSQKKTVTVLSMEAFLKFLIACLLFIYPFSIIVLTIILVAIRCLTLNLFLKIGAADGIVLTNFWRVELSFDDVKSILFNYWPFAVIGSAYIIYWKTATLIISKTLPLEDVAHYENSFKIFSLAQLIPIVISTTLLPKFVQFFKDDQIDKIQSLYYKVFKICMLYGIVAFTFTYSFADELLPLAFGEKYIETASYTKEMFFTMLIFPTSLLQAQILIAVRLEKLDMWFNINSVVINSMICLIGLFFIKSLTVVNFGIFVSFLIFHLLQDYTLYKRKITTLKHILQYVIISVLLVVSYIWLSRRIDNRALFLSFWGVIGVVFFSFFYQNNMSNSPKLNE